jgi:PAS domain S-box-containing protein
MNARVSLLVLALLALLSSGTGGILFYAHLSSVAEQEAVDDAEQAALMLSRQMSLHLERLGKSAASLAGLSQMRGLIKAEPQGLERAEAVLDHFCVTLGASVCYVMDRGGLTVASSNRGGASSFVGKNYAFRPYFQQAMEGRQAIYMALGVTSGERGIYHAAPIPDGKGGVLGVVVIKSGVEALERDFRDLGVIAALTDANGVVFLSNRSAWVFHALGGMDPAEAARLRESRQYGDRDIGTVPMRETGSRRAASADGATYVTARQPVDLLPGWQVVCFLDTARIGAALKGGEIWLANAFGFLFTLTGVAVVALFRTGTRDIASRQDAERALKRRIELERLLSVISGDFINVGAGQFRFKLVNTLMALGHFTGTERVVMFVRPPEGSGLVLEAEWAAGKMATRMADPPRYGDGDLTWLVSRLQQQRTVYIPRVADLPAEAHREREVLEALKVVSLLCIPLQCFGQFAGFIGFHALCGERRWSDEDLAMLTTAAEILSFAFERERTEERLRKLSLVVEQNPAAVVVTNRDGTIEYVNAQFEKVSGYTVAEALGQNPRVLKSGRMPPETYDELWRTIAAGKVWRGELQNKHKDGSLYWESAAIAPLVAGDGSVTHFIAVKEDITELKRVARELERSNAELEQFGYAVSHDLQQPLRIITSYLQLLDKHYAASLDDRGREFLGHAQDGGRRMQRMIKDLLEYSRVDRMGGEMVACDSGAVARDALANLTIAIREARAEVVVADLPAVIADEGQLKRLFQNLIGNAVKYRAPDRPVRVDVSAERAGGEWVFAVKDNGVGIDPANSERVFALFQRLHQARGAEGTGVGLALCRRIVTHHGGRIWLESAPERGTTFFFTLPAAG